MKVKEIMSREVWTIGRNDKLSHVENLMREKRIRHLPVVDDGRVVGMMSAHDLLHAAVSSAMGYGEKASQAFLDLIVAKEVMTEDTITIAPDDDVKHAARLMLERKIGGLPVMEGERLVGLVTESDVLRTVVES